MAVGCPFCDDQSLCNFAIRQAALDQRGDFEFSFAKWTAICAASVAAAFASAQYEIDDVVESVEPPRKVVMFGMGRCGLAGRDLRRTRTNVGRMPRVMCRATARHVPPPSTGRWHDQTRCGRVQSMSTT